MIHLNSEFFKAIYFGVWSEDLGYHIALVMQAKQALTHQLYQFSGPALSGYQLLYCSGSCLESQTALSKV